MGVHEWRFSVENRRRSVSRPPLPGFIEPALATDGPVGVSWIHEIKFDSTDEITITVPLILLKKSGELCLAQQSVAGSDDFAAQCLVAEEAKAAAWPGFIAAERHDRRLVAFAFCSFRS